MTRRRHLRFATACALALAGAALTGCSPSPAPTPSPTPAFASEEEAFAAAEETYRAYIDAFNNVDLQDPRTFAAIEIHTTGGYRSDEKEQLSQMKAQGYIRGGELLVVDFSGIETTKYGVRARTCEDVSNVTLENSRGESVVAADRPDRYALDVQFQLDQGTLLISETESVEDTECTEQ